MGTLSLCYDKGTLVLKGKCGELDDAAKHLGFVFDPRVECYRAPGFWYRRIKERQKLSSVEIRDHVADQLAALASSFAELLKPSVFDSLRDYQKHALELWLGNGRRGIVSLPTGAGKTRLAAAAIEQCSASVICLVPTLVLMYQWASEFRILFPKLHIGLLGEGHCSFGSVTISTYASAFLSAPKIGNKFDFLVVDEAHHFGEKKLDEILMMSAARYRLALTATPPHASEHLCRLESLMGRLISRQSVVDLMGRYLSSYEHFVLPVKLARAERVAYFKLEQQYLAAVRSLKAQGCLSVRSELLKSATGRQAMKARAEARRLTNNCMFKIRKIAELLAQFRTSRTIVFMGSVEAAMHLSEILFVPLITGEISKAERESLLANFRLGKISTLVTCQVLNEGFDIPETDLVIIAGGSQGKRELKQRIGRALRKKENKSAQIIELVSAGTLEEKMALVPMAGFLPPRRCTNIRGVSGD